MAVKKEDNRYLKLSAKGVLLNISAEGFVIEDEKSGDQEVLRYSDIKEMVGKSVNIVFANKEPID